MKTKTHTTIALDNDTYLYCHKYEGDSYTSLVLANCSETLSIQFSPQHVAVLENLIAQLRKIEAAQRSEKLVDLHQGLEKLQQEIQTLTPSSNGRGEKPLKIELVEF